MECIHRDVVTENWMSSKQYFVAASRVVQFICRSTFWILTVELRPNNNNNNNNPRNISPICGLLFLTHDYHIIMAPRTGKVVNHYDVDRKQAGSLNLSMKGDRRRTTSRCEKAVGDSIQGKHCDRALLCYSLTKVEYFFLPVMENRSGEVLQLLWFPPSPVCHSKTSFMPLWKWHAGNTMKQAWTQTTLPLAPERHCGTWWEEMLGQAKLKWGLCTHS